MLRHNCKKVFNRNLYMHQVGLLFLAQTMQTIFACVYLYRTLVLNFGSCKVSFGSASTFKPVYYPGNVEYVQRADWSECISLSVHASH